MRHWWSLRTRQAVMIGGLMTLGCTVTNRLSAQESTKITLLAGESKELDSPNTPIRLEPNRVSFVRTLPALQQEESFISLSDRPKEESEKTSSEEAPKRSPTASEPRAKTPKTQASSVKDPIVLPPLEAPNLSIQNVGTGKLPEDKVEGRLPPKQPLPYGPDRENFMSPFVKSWIAPTYCHQPLYFEDTMLERHGHEKCVHLTPFLSGARFYTTVVTSPYLACMRPPLKDISNAGHFRPGSHAPCVRERAPYDAAALRFQLLTTGVVFNLAP